MWNTASRALARAHGELKMKGYFCFARGEEVRGRTCAKNLTEKESVWMCNGEDLLYLSIYLFQWARSPITLLLTSIRQR